MNIKSNTFVLCAAGALLTLIATQVPTVAEDAKPIVVADVKHEGPVDFEKEILDKIFRRKCLACHNATDAESDLVLETPALVLKGGSEGPAVVPGKSAESLLLKVSSHQMEPFMPPPDNDVRAAALTPEELGLIKLWIDEGAKGEVTGASDKVVFEKLPLGVNPIYAVAVSPDGQYAAAGRANQIFIYHVPSKREIGRLTDPELLKSGVYANPGVAHLDLVQSLQFSPDNQTLASGGYKTVKLWHRPTNVQKAKLAGIETPAKSLAVSSDGKWAAIGEESGKIKVFDLSTNQLVKQLAGHTAAVSALQFSADGTKLFSGSKDKSLRTWNTTDGSQVARVDTPHEINALTLFAKDTQIATGGSDNQIRVWSVPASGPLKLAQVKGPISAIASSFDKKWIALSTADGRILLVDVATGATAKTLEGHPGGVSSLDFNPTSNRLISVGKDKKARVWNVADGQNLFEIEAGEIQLTVASTHPNGNEIVTGAVDGSVRVSKLDVPAPRKIVEDSGAPATVAATSVNGKLLATVGVAEGKPAIILRDANSGAVQKTLVGHEAEITSVSFSADASRVISGSNDKTARIWTIADGKEVAKLAEFTGPVVAVALNSNGQQAITVAADNVFASWNLADGKQQFVMGGHAAQIVSVAMTPNNQFIISASKDKTVRIWNPANGQQVRSIDVATEATAIAISADSQRLAAAASDKSVKLYQVADGKQLAASTNHAEPVHSLSFSIDNLRLLAADAKRVVVYETTKGTVLESQPITSTSVSFGVNANSVLVAAVDKTIAVHSVRAQRLLGDHAKKITGMAYSIDGAGVFTASEDGTVRRFATANGQQQFAANHAAPVHDLALSPNGQLLASAGENKQVRVWNSSNGGNAPKPQVDGFVGPVRQVAFSADSAKVIGADGGANQLLVFDMTSGTIEQSFVEHAAPTTLVCATGLGEAGTSVVSSAQDNTIRVWPLVAGRVIAGHSQPVTSLATVNDTQIISGSLDATLRHWNTANGQAVRAMNHGGPVVDVAVRPDGQRFASVSSSNSAKLWHAANGQQVAELKGDLRAKLNVGDQTRTVALALRKVNDTKKDLEEANKRKKAEEDNAKKAEEARKKAEEENNKKIEAAKKPVVDKEAADKELDADKAALVKAEAVKKAGDEAATKAAAELKKNQDALNVANKAATDAATALTQAQATLKQAQDAAKADPENKDKAAAATAAEKAVQLADANSKKAVEVKIAAMTAAQQADATKKAADAAKTKADQEFTAATNKVKATENKVKQLAGPAQKAVDERTAAERAFTAAKRSVERAAESVKKATEAVPPIEALIKTAEAEHQQKTQGLEAAKKSAIETEKPMFAVSFSSDGSTLATASENQIVQTWDSEAGTAIDTFTGQGAAVNLVGFTGDGNVISIGQNNSAVIWDTKPQWTLARRIGSMETPDLVDRVTSLAFSGDGKQLATGSGEPSRSGELKIWNVENGALIKEIKEPHSDTIFAIEFSPDGQYVATCGADRFVKVFNLAESKVAKSFEGHTHHVLGVSWRADGRMLASAGADNVIKIWDFRTGDQSRTIQGFKKEMTSIRYVVSADGNNISNVIVSSGDKNVYTRNSDNGGGGPTFAGGGDFMYSVDVSSDGNTIVAGGQDSVLRIWRANAQVVATFAPPQPDQTAAK